MRELQRHKVSYNLNKGVLTSTKKWLILLLSMLAIMVAITAFSGYKTIQYTKKINSKLEEYKKLQKVKLEEQLKNINSQLDAKQKEIEELKKQVSQKQKVQLAQTAIAKEGDVNDPKMFIYLKESGNNPGAINKSSGACGLGQALPCSKMPCSLSDYACQDSFFTKYMEARYGTWGNAKAFWLEHKWW